MRSTVRTVSTLRIELDDFELNLKEFKADGKKIKKHLHFGELNKIELSGVSILEFIKHNLIIFRSTFRKHVHRSVIK